jgi:hypothetical protein
MTHPQSGRSLALWISRPGVSAPYFLTRVNLRGETRGRKPHANTGHRAAPAALDVSILGHSPERVIARSNHYAKLRLSLALFFVLMTALRSENYEQTQLRQSLRS